MDIDLTDSLAKLGRAREHLHSMRKIQQSYARSKAHTLWVEPGPHSGEHIMWAKVSAPMPIEIRFLIGELAHCARSALDHLVYSASSLAHDDIDNRRGLQFPIVNAPKAYAQQEARFLRGVGDPVKAIIERYQPYNSLGVPRDGVIKSLAEINNADKHRLIPVVSGVSLTRLLEVTGDLDGCDYEIVGDGVITETGAPFLRCRITTEGKVDMKVNFPTTIMFDQGIPIVGGKSVFRVMPSIIYLVEEIVTAVAYLTHCAPPPPLDVPV